MKWILAFIGTLFLTIAQVYCWFELSKTKIDGKNKKIFFKVLMLTCLIFINHNFSIRFIRAFFTIFIAMLFCKLILKLDYKKTIILTFMGQLIIMISEAIIAGIIVFIFKIDTEIFSTIWMSFIFDIILAILTIIISRLKFLGKLYNKFIEITNHVKIIQLIIFITFVALGSSIFAISIYFKNNVNIALLFNILVSFLYTGIIISIFRYQNKYYKINSKYNMSLDDLQIQEKMLNNYRIMNHENKNQLLTIKGMTKSTKVKQYIDSLISSKKKQKDLIVNFTSKLPEGGLKGLIYSKLMYMKEKGIKYSLNVDKKITNKTIYNIESNDMVDICQILGVFIDNAIDETLKFKQKDLIINVYEDQRNLIIEVSNYHNYNKINDQNLKTTKGKNRGYGLQLVNRIITKNSKLFNKRIITKNSFVQQLIIAL